MNGVRCGYNPPGHEAGVGENHPVHPGGRLDGKVGQQAEEEGRSGKDEDQEEDGQQGLEDEGGRPIDPAI